MNKYPDFWSVLIGKGSAGFFFGYAAIAFICAGAIVLYDLSRRNKNSNRTPARISFRFWIADNLARVIANAMLIPIAIRLCYEYVGETAMLFVAAGIGFAIDGLGMIAKRFGILTSKKLAETIRQKIDNGKNDKQ